jgi:putative FmdB family regulatory protein
MPIFEYECLACGHKFEALKRLIDRDSKIKCPNCGSNNPKRVKPTREIPVVPVFPPEGCRGEAVCFAKLEKNSEMLLGGSSLHFYCVVGGLIRQ